jgi:hypothetical protein
MHRCKYSIDLVICKFLFSTDRILLVGNSSSASVLEILHREYLNRVDGPSHFVEKFIHTIDDVRLNAVETCYIASTTKVYVVAAGSNIQSGCGIAHIFVWESERNMLVPILAIQDAHSITSLSYNEKNDLLIFSNNNGEIIQFSLDQLIEVKRFQVDVNGITKIKLTHSDHLACLGNSLQSSVQIVDFRNSTRNNINLANRLSLQGFSASQKSRLTPTSQLSCFSSLDTHPNQSEIILGCHSGHVLLWDARNNRRYEYHPHSSRGTSSH